jgi:phytoene dehydrogenase-like protein
MNTDYLIVGSGLSALTFGALMASSGKKVQILEAHEHAGGFGHTFTMAKKYTFNAQFHYVWDCGEGQTVNRVLKKLGLDREINFERFDPNGFDHMRSQGHALDIPSDPEALIQRLASLFPAYSDLIRKFVQEVEKVGEGMKLLSPPIKPMELLQHPNQVFCTAQYLHSTLQDVFDKFRLPQAAQTLLALQWLDFLLPPNQLSFYAWVALFRGYQAGAFYPSQHFESVINALVKVIESHGGEVLFNYEVTNFRITDQTVTGVEAINLIDHQTTEFRGNTVICNIDPQKAAKMIGIEKFSKPVRRKLDYEYSASNYMAYCVVKDIDLRDFGFGKWNIHHSGTDDLNESFAQMYDRQDYSNPSFAITTPSLLTETSRDCPEDCQIVEFLTVANYQYFKELRESDRKAYNHKKQEILDSILDVVEAHYVPNFRKYMVFHITGSPTTNERYCWCPEGNSYGSALTPRNMGLGRLNHETSLKHFYFCNASSGYPGFAPTVWTGALLYQRLSGDKLLARSDRKSGD